MHQQTSVSAPGPSRRNLLIILFAGFVLSGIATTIVGPMLPIFIKRWSLDDGQAGLFSFIQFFVAFVGSVASGVIAAWKGYRPALVLGYALMGGGLAFLNADTLRVAMLATAAFGLGYGLTAPGTNLFVAELGGAKSASLLSQLNFAWGAGAMSCSALMALALKHNGLNFLLLAAAVFGGVLVLCLLFASFGAQKHEEQVVSADGSQSSPPIGLAVTIALAVLFFTYVAMENGIGIWTAEYAKRIAGAITGMTTLAPMFFYGGLTFGRAAAPLVLRRQPERKVVLVALALAAAAILLLIAASTLPVAVAAVFFAGLGCASVYPIYIAWLSRWYGARARKIGGVLFALSSLGGSAGPWTVGFVSKFFGSLRIGLLVPLFSALIMIGLVLLLRRRTAL